MLIIFKSASKYNSEFVKDSYLVEIDRSKSTPDRIKLSDKYHSDIIDAVLYSFKESPAFSYQEPIPKMIVGSREWQDAQPNAMWEAAQTHFEDQARISQALDRGGWPDDQ